jgi:hypothetical protein
MAGHVPAIHVLIVCEASTTWMPAQASLCGLRELCCGRGMTPEMSCSRLL